MNSTMFRINLGDVGRGAITAVVAAVIVALYGVVTQSGFDVFSADWHAIANTAINAGIGGFFGYIGKNFLTDTQGKFLGRIG